MFHSILFAAVVGVQFLFSSVFSFPYLSYVCARVSVCLCDVLHWFSEKHQNHRYSACNKKSTRKVYTLICLHFLIQNCLLWVAVVCWFSFFGLILWFWNLMFCSSYDSHDFLVLFDLVSPFFHSFFQSFVRSLGLSNYTPYLFTLSTDLLANQQADNSHISRKTIRKNLTNQINWNQINAESMWHKTRQNFSHSSNNKFNFRAAISVDWLKLNSFW